MNFIKKLNIKYNSPVILSFVFISGLVLLLNIITSGKSNYYLFSVHKYSGFNDITFYLRLFLHVLGHVDINHYTNNMLIILLIGPLLEEKYGSKNILLIILTTAFVTGIFNVLFTNGITLGASGVVFTFIILASFSGNVDGIPLTLLICALVFIGKEVINGITVNDNISQFSHIIGGIVGIIIGLYFQKNKNISSN